MTIEKNVETPPTPEPNSVRYSTKVRGASAMLDKLENVPTRNLWASKIEKPTARFHELQVAAEDANFIITNYAYPRQRNVSIGWAVEIGTLIEAGKLLPTMVHFAHCKADSKTYLVDGYHRMAGCAMAKSPMLFPVEHHYCDTMEEVDSVYSRLDQGVPRTFHAAIRATGADRQLGLPDTKIQRLAAAAAIIKHDFHDASSMDHVRSASLKIEAVREWEHEARLYHQATYGGNGLVNQKLWRGAVAAVALVCFRYEPELASEFFRKVATMACESDTGEQALLSALINRSDKRVNTEQLCRWTAAAWNASFESRRMSVLTLKEAGRPINIYGTPWAGPKLIHSGPDKGQTLMPYQQHFRDLTKCKT